MIDPCIHGCTPETDPEMKTRPRMACRLNHATCAYATSYADEMRRAYAWDWVRGRWEPRKKPTPDDPGSDQQ